MRVMLAAILAATAAASSSSAAFTVGECLMEVDERTWFEGRCNVTLEADGSIFFNRADVDGSPYFGSVDATENGFGTGWWNGPTNDDHAHHELGTMTYDGACWSNDRARVCAWNTNAR